MRVLIAGGGAIGASTAFFLSRRGAEVTLVERTGIACAASGKSGGFLAYDWCDGTPLQALARRSFDLHAELAGEIDDDWGYRRMTTYGGFGGARSLGNAPAWVSESVALDRRLGTTATTAQVHPGLYTQAMMRAAEALGVRHVAAEVTNVELQDDLWRMTTGEGGSLDGDAVVVAMGPWSVLAAQWLPLPAVYGLKGHSLVFDTGKDIPADALFLEMIETGGTMSSPEVFPRADGTTYVCGISSESPVPLDPADVEPDPDAIQRLETICRDISPVLREASILARQACFRPVTRDGLPLIGAVAPRAYVATGHSVWGILNAPATGEAMAELILDGRARTVDLSPFDPRRAQPLDPSSIRRIAS